SQLAPGARIGGRRGETVGAACGDAACRMTRYRQRIGGGVGECAAEEQSGANKRGRGATHWRAQRESFLHVSPLHDDESPSRTQAWRAMTRVAKRWRKLCTPGAGPTESSCVPSCDGFDYCCFPRTGLATA